MPQDARNPDRNPGSERNVAGADPDSDLVRRMQSGDPRGLEALIRKYQDGIHALVLRMVDDAGAAEELAQDTFLRAWRNIDRFRGESRVSTWLYRIAVNLCRDHHGSRRVRDRLSETSLAESERTSRLPASPRPGPDARLEEQEVADHFRQALEGLEPAYREAFLLRHQQGLAPGEIAEALGISPGNAKVRVHRAREMILETLRRLGHDV